MPTKSSLSLTVDGLYTNTTVEAAPGSGRVRKFVLNGAEYGPGTKEWERVQAYLERLAKHVSRDFLGYDYVVESENNFPTAAGLASSASGFAALAKALLGALAAEHSWAEELLRDERRLSAVARLGSGSASRSVGEGAKLWHRGWDREGFDPVWGSYAETVAPAPKNIVLAYVLIRSGHKKVPSREGMKRSMQTSPFYWHWVETEEKEIERDVSLLRRGAWEELFPRIIQHSNAFHAVCRSTYPPIEYLSDASISLMERVHSFTAEYGGTVAYTFDAGPNAVLFILEDVLEDAKREVLGGFDYVLTRPR